MEPSSVMFSLRNSDKSGYIRINPKLGSADPALYNDDKQGMCSRCYPVTSYCRGHLGYFELQYEHVNYVCRALVDLVLECLCTSCSLPLRRLPSKSRCKLRKMWHNICTLYLTQCVCTGTRETGKSCTRVTRIQKVYSYMISEGILEKFLEISFLGPENCVISKYVLILPEALLEQIPGGGDVLSAYSRLLSRHGVSTTMEDEDFRVTNLWKAMITNITGKRGFYRKMLVPRRVGHSSRGVIVSNPDISLCAVSCPQSMCSSLASELIVTSNNLQQCVTAIFNSEVSRLMYGRKSYKLCKSEVALHLDRCTSATGEVVDMTLPMGTVCSCTGENFVYKKIIQPNNIVEMSNILRDYSIKTFTISGINYSVSGYVLVTLYVYVTKMETRDQITNDITGVSVMRIPLQVGSKLFVYVPEQLVTLHRNPVMGASSMNDHILCSHKSVQNAVLSLEQKHNQKLCMLPANTPILDVANVASKHSSRLVLQIRKSVAKSDDTMSTYRMESVVPVRCYSDIPLSQEAIQISPFATQGYNADFDGDEMNVAKHLNPKQDYTIINNIMLGEIGPNHDSKYGLYLITNNKVSSPELSIKHEQVLVRSISTMSGRITSQVLVDSGLSLQLSLELANLDSISISKLVASMSWSTINCSQTCQRFLLNLRLDSNRLSIRDNKTFNNYFCKFIKREDIVSIFVSEYLEASNNTFGKLYADICKSMCLVADMYQIVFDRHSKDSVAAVVESGCRPSSATVASIYDRVGIVSTITPKDKIRISMIHNSYREGVTLEQYKLLCYANRMQAVVKAVNISPQGDNMRMQSSYCSDLEIDNSSIRYRGKIVCRVVTCNTSQHLRESEYIESYRGYSNVVSYNEPLFEYRGPEDRRPECVATDKILVPHGRLKLALTEIDFLTDVVLGPGLSNVIVVYAGAASGAHIAAMSLLMPNVMFHLYDKSSFSANLYDKTRANRTRQNIQIHKEYITVELATRRYASISDRVVYISDLRTREQGYDKPTSKDVSDNNRLNMDVVRAINPIFAMLKFRLPFEPGTTLLPEGELRLQPWAPKHSTEVRLVCSRPYNMIEYSHTLHEKAMYTHWLTRHKTIPNMNINMELQHRLKKFDMKEYYDVYREDFIIKKYCRVMSCQETTVYKRLQDANCLDYDYYIKLHNK